MQHSLKSLSVLLFIFFSALISCKENTIINSKISPASDSIGVYSTSLGCITHTYFDDTSITNLYLGLPVVQGVGAMEDPYFGTMIGATYFQILPTVPSSTLYTGKTIDSAVLILPYSGVSYGDTTDQAATQTYQVFYVTDTISSSNSGTLYYSYTTKTIDSANPLSPPYTVNLYHLRDSLSVKGVNYNPALRIPLSMAVLRSHLDPALALVTNSSSQTADFLNAFRGVCVKVANNNTTSSMPYFQLDGNGATPYSGAGIVVYYHTTGGGGDTTERYYFNPTYCGYFNNIKKSFTSYPVNSLLTSTQSNDSVVALQNQPGPNIDVVIPGLKSLPKGVINKADLQIALLPDANQDKFAAPTRLTPRGVGNGIYPAGIVAGLTYNVADRFPLYSTTPYIILDGEMHPINHDGTTVNTYTIGIPREIMTSIAASNDTLHLHIIGTQDYFGAFHMIAGGGNHPNPLYRAKLFVVYSKLN